MPQNGSSKSSSVTTTLVGDPQETTPLLTKVQGPPTKWSKSVVYRVLFAGFIVSLSFGVTQVPIIDVFRIMTCDEYYKTHPEPAPGISRCKNSAIEAARAESIALLGMFTTLFGVANLFVTGWTIKAFGVKKALLVSIFWPAIRLAVQNVGVQVGAGLGITIIQLSQIMTIVGGPAGYMLALNTFAAEVVEPADRTGTLGRLSGCNMFGTALGFLSGGLLSDAFGIIIPFRVTFAMFLISSIYAFVALPVVPINKEVAAKASKSLGAFFEPLKMFFPQKWALQSGKVQREYGVLLLGIGAFLGILATGYITTLLQMYSTDVFDFSTTNNGWLIFVNASVRGAFLTLAFPKIITSGRKWLNSRHEDASKIDVKDSAIPDLPTDPDQLAEVAGPDENSEPIEPPKPAVLPESFAFDLMFTKYSLIVDGLLTGAAVFTAKGWEMYIIAVVLPLASGTGPAAKGTMLQMCTSEQRADALSAISLVEMIARLSTIALFGYIYAGFSTIGQPYLTFACNAAVAVIGFVVLLFARFPPEGATRFIQPVPSDDETDNE